MSSKGNYENPYLCEIDRYAKESRIVESIIETSNAIIESLKAIETKGSGKIRNKMTHLKPKKKKRK